MAQIFMTLSDAKAIRDSLVKHGFIAEIGSGAGYFVKTRAPVSVVKSKIKLLGYTQFDIVQQKTNTLLVRVEP